MTDDIRTISITRISDPHQPMRSKLALDTIAELAESIKERGLINPITVRPIRKNADGASVALAESESGSASDVGIFYEVVAGHRRITACRLAALSDVPCVVRILSDEQSLAVMAHENLERQDVDPVDEALMIGRYVGEDENKIIEVAKLMHRSEAWVRARLAILTYPDYLVLAIREGKVALGVANWLGGIEDDVYRKMFVMQAARDGMKVWQAETLYRQWEGGLFKPGEEILPPAEHPDGEPVRVIREHCAKCGQLTDLAYLRMVHIHSAECPEKEESPKATP